MRRSLLLSFGLLLAAGPALAAEPTGEWLVEDKVAQVKVENCGGALWGIISWETKPGGRDNENPDPALRGRPVLGMPILIEMKPTTVESWGKTEQRWKGHVYNSQNGKTYDASIKLLSPDVLKIEGCVAGIFCGGQEWTRVAQSTPPATSGQVKGPAPKGKEGTQKGAPAAITDVCSRVANLPGRPH